MEITVEREVQGQGHGELSWRCPVRNGNLKLIEVFLEDATQGVRVSS